jgi:hypothetical protein
MKTDCLQHRLTEAERRTFDETGYLVLEDVLPSERVGALTALADGIHAREVANGFDPRKGLFYPNFIPESTLFQSLVDHDRVLPKVWGHSRLEHLPVSRAPDRDAAERRTGERQNVRLASG